MEMFHKISKRHVWPQEVTNTVGEIQRKRLELTSAFKAERALP